MVTEINDTLIFNTKIPNDLKKIAEKVYSGVRITEEDGLWLYQKADLSVLADLANHVRETKNGNNAYFIHNYHIEPTNICVFTCDFCSYSRLPKEDGWEKSRDEILEIVITNNSNNYKEVHIVGGVHPKRGLLYYAQLIRDVKKLNPEIHIKALTAVELEYLFRKAKVTVKEGLLILKEHGLNSIPGGGAEIFHPNIRNKICADKATTEQWLEIHKTAHTLGIPSNATMLYGHIEKYEHRIDHLEKLRQLQDETKGFNAFIPLKFRNKENEMSYLPEIPAIEDLKNYAVSRIYLDNFNHIKAYWPMIGKQTTSLSLSFGVDDVDGTIDDSTKIYSMAGVEDQNPVMTTEQLKDLIINAGRTPIERDAVYGEVIG